MAVFEVAIGPDSAPGRYRVQVIDSPTGHASTQTELDVEGLAARRGLLQQAVLASAVAARGIPETEQVLRAAGQQLFAALLGAGQVGGRYYASAAVAAVAGEALRVVLRIDDPALAGLPWEAMFDQESGMYVCRQDQLVRHIPVASVPAPLQVRPPLRILGVVSSPTGLYPLDAAKEKDHLDRALARLAALGVVQVHWAPDPTWAGLQDLLMEGEWHVLHFIGHGAFDPARDEGMLALARDDGRADWIAASRMTDLLRQARPIPRLVVLNSCVGAAAGAADLFSGTAAALVRGGISAVAAMQYTISDPAAIAFTRGFYGAIARGRGVDDAMTSGRVAILGTSDQTLEWVTPVLYLRGRETRLFIIPEPSGISITTNTATTPPAEAVHEPSVPATHDAPTARPDLQLARILKGHMAGVTAVTFGPSGLLATASYDNTSRLWDTATGTPERVIRSLRSAGGSTFNRGGGMLCGVAISPDGDLLAITGGYHIVQLWDPTTGEHLRTFTGHEYTASGVAFSPDGHQLAIGSDCTARLWDPATGEHLRTLTGHEYAVSAVAFSPDGHLFATASWDSTTRLWDPASGEHLHTVSCNANSAYGVAFSPDGQLLATASGDCTAQLWDTAAGRHLRTLTGHKDRVYGVAFSPDGHLLATASGDCTAQLWDTATGRHLRTLTGHKDRVYGVAFSPDGNLLATASEDNTVRLWA